MLFLYTFTFVIYLNIDIYQKSPHDTTKTDIQTFALFLFPVFICTVGSRNRCNGKADSNNVTTGRLMAKNKMHHVHRVSQNIFIINLACLELCGRCHLFIFLLRKSFDFWTKKKKSPTICPEAQWDLSVLCTLLDWHFYCTLQQWHKHPEGDITKKAENRKQLFKRQPVIKSRDAATLKMSPHAFICTDMSGTLMLKA